MIQLNPNHNSDEKANPGHKRNKMSVNYNNERRRTPNLGWIDAKESFKKDLMHARDDEEEKQEESKEAVNPQDQEEPVFFKELVP